MKYFVISQAFLLPKQEILIKPAIKTVISVKLEFHPHQEHHDFIHQRAKTCVYHAPLSRKGIVRIICKQD